MAAGAVLVSLLALGCAGVTPVEQPTAPAVVAPTSQESGWWYVRFIRDWPENSPDDPAWHLDLLIANEIVAPAIYRHEVDIPLWRFHRRAVHDDLGHALSFILYSTPQTAEAVYAEIRSAPLLDAMTASGALNRVAYDDTSEIKRPHPEDVSDGNWPLVLQKAWPHFIMGASRTWLDLVAKQADALGREQTQARLPELETLYLRVNDAIDDLWEQEGRHAFLHHLNAVFGYRPLVIYERKLLSF
jgi:hypothetical protein